MVAIMRVQKPDRCDHGHSSVTEDTRFPEDDRDERLDGKVVLQLLSKEKGRRL